MKEERNRISNCDFYLTLLKIYWIESYDSYLHFIYSENILKNAKNAFTSNSRESSLHKELELFIRQDLLEISYQTANLLFDDSDDKNKFKEWDEPINKDRKIV